MFDDHKIPITCTAGHTTEVTLSRARRSPTIQCAVCGQTIRIEGTDLDAKLKGVEGELDKLRRSIRDIGR